MTHYYSEDLAYVHHKGYSDFANHAAIMIVKTLNEQLNKKGLVIDLGCGSGVVAKALVNNQFEVLGIDQSQSLIKLAKERVPQAQFVVGSFFEIPLPPCIAVVSTSECFNYILGEGKSNLETLFQHIFSALEKGGLFIFDMIEPGDRADRKLIVEQSDWTMFCHIHEEVKTNTLSRNITLFRKTNGLYRKSKEVHQVKLYPHEVIISWLEKAGFKVNLFKNYDNLTLDEHHHGFIGFKTLLD